MWQCAQIAHLWPWNTALLKKQTKQAARIGTSSVQYVPIRGATKDVLKQDGVHVCCRTTKCRRRRFCWCRCWWLSSECTRWPTPSPRWKLSPQPWTRAWTTRCTSFPASVRRCPCFAFHSIRREQLQPTLLPSWWCFRWHFRTNWRCTETLTGEFKLTISKLWNIHVQLLHILVFRSSGIGPCHSRPPPLSNLESAKFNFSQNYNRLKTTASSFFSGWPSTNTIDWASN